jgi:cytoskeletal protein RodZ
MGNFGEELRKERLARGVALEDISAVTKITRRHLIALEQERFRLLPGGILSKGIVRGYAGALGLDAQDWTERFLRACDASGQMSDDERGWTTFASNVGKARILHREAVEVRLRWLGAILMLLAVAAGGFLAFRYYGLRQNWWSTLLPMREISAAFDGAWNWTSNLFARFLAWLRG